LGLFFVSSTTVQSFDSLTGAGAYTGSGITTGATTSTGLACYCGCGYLPFFLPWPSWAFGSALTSTFGSTFGCSGCDFSFFGYSTDFFSAPPFLAGGVGDTGSATYFFSSTFGLGASLTGSATFLSDFLFFSFVFVGTASVFFLLSGDFETELLVTTATGFGGAAITYLGFFGFGPPRFINLFCYYLLPTASYNSFSSFFDGLYSSSVAPPFTIILFF